MGKRGPAPKPTALRILHGDREDRINRNEPLPVEGGVVSPVELTEAAAAVWDRLAPDLLAKRVITAWDTDAFAEYCDQVAIYWECRDHLQADGLTAKGAAGGVIKSPFWQIMRDASANAAKIRAKFGLTPSDRSQLSIGGQDDAVDSAAARFMA